MSDPSSNASNQDLLATSTFHDWWISELRSSIAPTACDVEPEAPEPPAPEAQAEPPRPEPRGKLLFAAASGLFWGAAMIVLLDAGSGTSEAAAAAPPPVIGSVEVGDIQVMNQPAEPAPPFDRAAATRALETAASDARSCAAGTRGSARVEVKFAASGEVERARVTGGSLAGTRVARCIAERMQAIELPAFSGRDVIVKKTVRLGQR